MSYIPPTYKAPSFTCPHCEVVTAQTWSGVSQVTARSQYTQTSHCQSSDCGLAAVWIGGKTSEGLVRLTDPVLIWPPVRRGPAPNPDLNEASTKDYEEARAVLRSSPRAAAALLRLALQRLMVQLGQPGVKINDDIAALVKEGLNPMIQKAADIVRVTGNDAVHPGEIDTDDEETVLRLFDLINLIVNDRVTQPAQIEALYGGLPDTKRDAIQRRDGAPGSESDTGVS